MEKQLAIWKFIRESLSKHIPVMLLYVLESSGSSPGRHGFFMAVSPDNMEGSIGGGIMEHKFVEMAKEQLQVTRDQLSEAKIRKQIHDKSAGKNQSGMICSGEQTMVLYRVQKKDIKPIENLIFSLEKNKNGAENCTSAEGLNAFIAFRMAKKVPMPYIKGGSPTALERKIARLSFLVFKK
jgi:xanthine dehydrogenase accessory factor